MRYYVPFGCLLTVLLLLAVPNSIYNAGKLTIEQRAAAKHLYNTRCITCHRLRDPANYPDDEWKLWMTKMSQKAKLDANQEQLLSRYLEELRSEAKPRK